jgi:abortive infection bacteriophage resistance protein
MKKMQRPWINNNIGQNRVFYNLTIIKYFLDIISPSNHLKQNLLELFKKYPSADKKAMGFPGEWGNEPLWK